jgi:hypothetical protein
MPAASQAVEAGRIPKSTAPKTGVRTTNRPVMKPALEAVVCWRPSVWAT